MVSQAIERTEAGSKARVEVLPAESVLSRFIDMAKAGKNRNPSGGEHAAREIARVLCFHAPTLDDNAVLGLIEYVTFAAIAPGHAREAIG